MGDLPVQSAIAGVDMLIAHMFLSSTVQCMHCAPSLLFYRIPSPSMVVVLLLHLFQDGMINAQCICDDDNLENSGHSIIVGKRTFNMLGLPCFFSSSFSWKADMTTTKYDEASFCCILCHQIPLASYHRR